MRMEPTPTCRIFISRNRDDHHVSETIRGKLEELSGNLEFFDDCDIEPGEGWRERLREELKRANLLLLLLTKPSRDDFDWPLYEAGLFDSLDEEERRRVICIYPDLRTSGVEVPSQLADRQAVTANQEALLKFLRSLFHDKSFTNTITPLHRTVRDERLAPLAREIADSINRVEPERISKLEYANYYIQIVLLPESSSLEPETEILSNERSLRHLFGLGECPPEGTCWSWAQLVAGLEERNLRWVEELVGATKAIKAGRFFSQISGLFLAQDGKLYRPAIEIYRRYENRRMTVDVSFAEQAQDAWLRAAKPPVLMAARLELASRVRYELIEPYLRRMRSWRKKKWKERGCAELQATLDKIEDYEYFLGKLIGGKFEEGFSSLATENSEAEALGEELDALSETLEDEIKPQLREALESQALPKLRGALQRWDKNNSRFLEACLQRFQIALAA